MITTTGTSNSFIIKSCAQHRQSVAIPFYLSIMAFCRLGAVITGEAVSVNKLRFTSLINPLCYCRYCSSYLWINVVCVQISVLS